MKFIVTTTFDNVDTEWLAWYMDRIKNEEHLPGSVVIVDELVKAGYAKFSSKDPDSEITATTEYEVVQ